MKMSKGSGLSGDEVNNLINKTVERHIKFITLITFPISLIIEITYECHYFYALNFKIINFLSFNDYVNNMLYIVPILFTLLMYIYYFPIILISFNIRILKISSIYHGYITAIVTIIGILVALYFIIFYHNPINYYYAISISVTILINIAVSIGNTSYSLKILKIRSSFLFAVIAILWAGFLGYNNAHSNANGKENYRINVNGIDYYIIRKIENGYFLRTNGNVLFIDNNENIVTFEHNLIPIDKSRLCSQARILCD